MRVLTHTHAPRSSTRVGWGGGRVRSSLLTPPLVQTWSGPHPAVGGSGGGDRQPGKPLGAETVEKYRSHEHRLPPGSQMQTYSDSVCSSLPPLAVGPPVAANTLLHPGTRNHPSPTGIATQIEGSLSRLGTFSTPKSISSTLTGMHKPEQPLLGRRPGEGWGRQKLRGMAPRAVKLICPLLASKARSLPSPPNIISAQGP